MPVIKRRRRFVDLLACGIGLACAAAVHAEDPTDTVITPLLEKPLTVSTNPVGSMLTVEYAPGAGTPAHRHPADTFVYVLEGAIEMQVKGGELVTLQAGETYYESPTDEHIVSRNASKTARAKFLVFFVKDKTAPVLVPTAH